MRFGVLFQFFGSETWHRYWVMYHTVCLPNFTLISAASDAADEMLRSYYVAKVLIVKEDD